MPDESNPVTTQSLVQRAATRTSLFFYLVAACLIFIGFSIAFKLVAAEDGKVALFFFCSAAGVILVREFIYLLPHLKTFKVGKDGVTGEFEKAVEELTAKVNKQETTLAQVETGIAENEQVNSSEPMLEKRLLGATNAEDQQKGRFGGEPVRNGRRLTADVAAVDAGEEWFRIRLKVLPDRGSEPVEGRVTFYLHQTFKNPKRVVEAKNGVAALTVYAYGAFTVGAVLDDGKTSLELDLSELDKAPEIFKER